MSDHGKCQECWNRKAHRANESKEFHGATRGLRVVTEQSCARKPSRWRSEAQASGNLDWVEQGSLRFVHGSEKWNGSMKSVGFALRILLQCWQPTRVDSCLIVARVSDLTESRPSHADEDWIVARKSTHHCLRSASNRWVPGAKRSVPRNESALRLSSTPPTISAGQLARRADLK